MWATDMVKELHSYSLSEGWLELIDTVSFSTSSKGSVINISMIDDPYWRFNCVSGELYPDQAAKWSAWKNSLRGGLEAFLAYDVRRMTPLEYPDAKGPSDIYSAWDGLGVVLSLGASGLLGIEEIPPNYRMSAGDRVGIENGTNYGYYEVIEDAISNADGEISVKVSPFLHTSIFETGDMVRLWRPKCQLIIDGRSWQEGGQLPTSMVSFMAYQRL